MEYVKLSNRDLELLIDCVQEIVNFKTRTLTAHNWSVFEKDYLPPLIEYLSANQFKVVTSSDNICLWLIDQICHSRRLTEGIKPKECIPLADTELGQSCLEFLRAASKGQQSYLGHCHNQQFTKLFL